MNPTVYLAALTAALALITSALGIGCIRLVRQVATLENYMLGVQYDTGLLAIALDDAGIPIHDDLRESAYHARRRVQ